MRDRIDELGDAVVVLVFFTAQRDLRGYRSRFNTPFTCVTSEDRSAYRTYRLQRGSVGRVWGPKVWLAYIRLLRKGRRFERPSEDTLQLGGDFVVGRDGQLVYEFRSKGPDDRPPIDDLVAAVSRA